jgi:hypothetical protein
MSTTNIITITSQILIDMDHSSAIEFRNGTRRTKELDAFISAWEETAKRQPLPRAPAKAPKPLRGPKERAPCGVRRGGRERAQSLQAKFQAGFQAMNNE